MAKQVRPKYSKDLLNLRKIQETLAKQKDYGEAHKMKLKADALEELLSSNLAALRQPNAFLQVYLRPLKGRETIVIATMKDQAVSLVVASPNGEKVKVTTSVEKQVHNHIQDVSQQLIAIATFPYWKQKCHLS